MLPESLKNTLSKILSEKTGMPVSIEKASSIGGGCINDSFRIETSSGPFFVKYNDSKRYPGMFESEARGLNLLREHSMDLTDSRASGQHHDQAIESPKARSIIDTTSGDMSGDKDPSDFDGLPGIVVPKVIAHGTDERHSFLILEFLEGGTMGRTFWDDFGCGMAQLHKNTDRQFGLDHSNYIGSLTQSNQQHDSWIDFFITERIEAQLRMARDSGRSGRELGKRFQDLYPHLSDFFPEEPPALLHGDLWSGNYMAGPGGKAAIVDPAVYYGHRYMDMGMSKLFGGFSPAFYHAYEANYPMEKNWSDGIEIANLYPLMVHLNLFGGGYLGSIETTLRRFRR